MSPAAWWVSGETDDLGQLTPTDLADVHTHERPVDPYERPDRPFHRVTPFFSERPTIGPTRYTIDIDLPSGGRTVIVEVQP